ncbi:hypothetical protein U876_10070 [Aeromonas hydrophila NJ-35]|nr:hypothetical protein U876_10070 [Aeromonas hydrophila NJ-35]ALZ79879.1 hypothetical protein AhyD4_09855 [Aeromonas hydrophila]ANR99856.1 hypothetical protein A9258_09575 [Aeromonas hydrophila]AXV29782.1 hypothetical protein BFW97_09870 [Aeromonas hydrophila]MBC6399017.1 hypothetical protein [Aeromonas hydrophila]
MKNISPSQVVADVLMRMMRGFTWNALNESFWSENLSNAGFPRMLRTMMWNLDSTEISPTHSSKMNLHLCKGCLIYA